MAIKKGSGAQPEGRKIYRNLPAFSNGKLENPKPFKIFIFVLGFGQTYKDN